MKMYLWTAIVTLAAPSAPAMADAPQLCGLEEASGAQKSPCPPTPWYDEEGELQGGE